MKRFLFMILILMFAVPAFADRIVSDPTPSLIGADFEIWQAAKGLPDNQVVSTGKLITTKAYQPDGSVEYNVDSLVSGTYYWYFRTVGKAYVYGDANTQGGSTVYSVFVPFAFTKRNIAGGSIPALKLAP